MKTRFNKNMRLTSKNMTHAVDDILEMWFIVDTKMSTCLSHLDSEAKSSLVSDYSLFCQNAFLLVGKLSNKSLDIHKRGEAVEYIKDAHDAVLFFVGGEGFKQKHNFDERSFDNWLAVTIQALYDNAV